MDKQTFLKIQTTLFNQYLYKSGLELAVFEIESAKFYDDHQDLFPKVVTNLPEPM